MSHSRLWRCVVIGCLIAALCGANWFYPRTRPKYKTGIPVRNYQYKATSKMVSAYSKEAVPKVVHSEEKHRIINGNQIQTIPGGILQKKIKVFQLPVAKLQVDHCSISQVAFMIESNGRWSLSLRGDQNFAIAGEEGSEPPFQPQTGQFTDFIKRNQFVVTIRCLGFFGARETEQIVTTGKPALFEVGPERFWVQRAKPYYYFKQGCHDKVQRYFDHIDRVEVQFYYH